MDVCRFAPSTTGPAHPGTLLAALLCWLDARARGGRLVLRMEDLDPQRCRPEWSEAMLRDLAWLGLDWDRLSYQHQFAESHARALDALAAAGRLYPCSCSRARIRDHGEAGPDGGFRYPGWCRERELPTGGWRASREPLRARLPAGALSLQDEGGCALVQDPALLGDPVVRRRDGSVAYLLATVVDDGAAGVTRVVRGRDLAPTTACQVALQQRLGLPRPVYRHHLLLLEDRGGEAGPKLAKFHGAIDLDALRGRYGPEALCGLLARAAGLRERAEAVTPAELLEDFAWERVRRADRLLEVGARGELHLA